MTEGEKFLNSFNLVHRKTANSLISKNPTRNEAVNF